MRKQPTTARFSFGYLNPQEKQEQLNILSDFVWDIETELAEAKAARAALMNSLQADRRGRL
jgi:hypothetical protein